ALRAQRTTASAAPASPDPSAASLGFTDSARTRAAASSRIAVVIASATSPKDSLEPRSRRGGDGVEVGREPAVAPYLDRLPAAPGRGHPDRVVRALHGGRRDGDGIELGESARALAGGGPTRPEQREREAEHAGRAGRRGGAAGDPRAGRATARDEWQA